MPLGRIIEELPDDFGGWTIIEVDRPTVAPFESALLSRSWLAGVRGEAGSASR